MLTLLSLAALFFSQGPDQTAWRGPGWWDAWLESPGGKIPFDLVTRPDASGELRVWLSRADERVDFPEVDWDGERLVLGLPHYDARIEASLAKGGGGAMEGEWVRRSGPESWTRLPFRAKPHRNWPQTARARTGRLDGRWAVDFSSSEDPAVGVFSGVGAFGDDRGEHVRGTFLTTLGDYRWLSGRLDTEGGLELHAFDGAHAFLFRARFEDDGSLSGDFWSGDSWHETWTARRDPNAALPDPFQRTGWNPDVALGDLVFRDLEGNPRSLGEEAFAGRARLLVAFGSWCPNCHDEAPLLAELDRRYRERGLSIVGLAFELTGELERDALQVRRFAERHGLRFPLLLAGTADKTEASERLPLLERVHAYPTTIFLRGDGSVRAVHTGFAGPATGAEHRKLRADFERLIEELL